MTPSPHPAEAQEREAIPAEIMRIIESLHTQDNRITDNPLFAVQQRRRIYGLDRDYEDGHVFDDEGTETGRRVGYKDTWEFVTGCLTEQGCKDFIAVNGHNLHEPRIYAYGSYRNAEFIALRKWLMSLRGASHAPAAAAASGEAVHPRDELERDYLAALAKANPAAGAEPVEKYETVGVVIERDGKRGKFVVDVTYGFTPQLFERVYLAPPATSEHTTMTWQPIKTAPRDGTNILIAFGQDGVSQAKYVPGLPNHPWQFLDTNDGVTWLVNYAKDGLGGPTHWKTLPQWPEPAIKGGSGYGETPANSLPHIAKLARAALDAPDDFAKSLLETLDRIAVFLGIDLEAAKAAPGKPSDVYIAAIKQKASAQELSDEAILQVWSNFSVWGFTVDERVKRAREILAAAKAQGGSHG